MKSEDKAEKIDQLMSHLSAADQPAPDFDRWLREHPQAARNLTSRAEHAEHSISLSVQGIWRNIMKSKLIKLTAAAVIIIGIFLGVQLFMGTNDSGLAFAKVLKNIQTTDYTFDLTIIEGDHISHVLYAMVQQPGKVRLDSKAGFAYLGGISSIIDIRSDKSLLLFHRDKAAWLMETPGMGEIAGVGQIVALSRKPVENLWNLRDGAEIKLDPQDIEGQPAEGFKIFQEDRFFRYEITLWALSETAVPVRVEISAQSQDDSASIQWTMNHFQWDVDLDEKLFSLEAPAGYTLAHQTSLEKLRQSQDSTGEAQKVETLLTLWSQGKKEQALRDFLSIDWTQTMEFSLKSYLFTMTEKRYISLKPDDQKQVMNEIMTSSSGVRELIRSAITQGQEACAAGNYALSEKYFQAGVQYGRTLNRHPENMLVVRLVGIAIQKRCLDELIKLYKSTNTPQKQQEAIRQRESLEKETQEIKKSIQG